MQKAAACFQWHTVRLIENAPSYADFALAVWWQMKFAQNSRAALVTPWHHALEVFSDCQPSSLCFFDLVCTAGLQAALAAGCQHIPAVPTATTAAGAGLTG